MNLLFLTLTDFNSIEERNIYTDLLREFAKHGHRVFVVSPTERRKKQNTRLIKEEKATILKLRIGNIQKTNIIEKGISTLIVEPQIISGIKRFFSDIKFDLVIYSTPPITFCSAIEFVKKRDGAKTYLLLKDIFPQNAVDLGMMKKTGLKGLIYKYFRNKEKRLYRISDRIGCMSPGNVEYILDHNPEVSSSIVEVCPNCVEVIDRSVDKKNRDKIREKYNIPKEKMVFVYGGNLGKPQGIEFMLECIKSQSENNEVFFLVVGDGTEFGKIEKFISSEKPRNVKLMRSLSKEDYDNMIGACDIGLIFLDHRFTIPNFPSRLLSYMQAGMPVFACTDTNTDLGRIIVNSGFGWWCESNDTEEFSNMVSCILRNDIKKKGQKGLEYLKTNYSNEKAYQIIIHKFGKVS